MTSRFPTGALIPNLPTLIINRIDTHRFAKIKLPTTTIHHRRHRRIEVTFSNRSSDGEDEHNSVRELTVPSHWLDPSKASEESEWLRVTLHKWLDDEYCPEPTNIEISKVAADSFYKSLVEERADLGDILIKMAVDLESISYQESFHGAFSSANAAVNLIIQRILHE